MGHFLSVYFFSPALISTMCATNSREGMHGAVPQPAFPTASLKTGLPDSGFFADDGAWITPESALHTSFGGDINVDKMDGLVWGRDWGRGWPELNPTQQQHS
eukprot:NODE_6106_length_372_cov_25.501548_g5387_i0.p2 GENE.NODE_6106_length_372_cov_25.501548_g5387_i0~~NODE_6106_length_372_cov_25.501548_g5387_i0.p2  ORF type:complete len:102 (-),score=22.36 NODE_6106_length_372_cov_25.501548_g5387_i0:65-370(-)